MKKDIKDTLEVMNGLPVTIRLLDPPLHEFVPQEDDKRAELAKDLGIDKAEFVKRVEALHETNPMMGHRGVRLGVTYPEITEMQVRAILEAAVELTQDGNKVMPGNHGSGGLRREELDRSEGDRRPGLQGGLRQV